VNILLDGTTAYYAYIDGFLILDVTDPSRINTLGHASLQSAEGWVVDMDRNGTNLLLSITATTRQLKSIDIGQLTNMPSKTFTPPTSPGASTATYYPIQLVGDTLYAQSLGFGNQPRGRTERLSL